METQFDNNDLIERFLEGSLSEQEVEDFNQRIKKDYTFAEALAQRRLLQKTYVEIHRQAELRNQIRSIVLDENQKVAYRRMIWLAAATLLILTALGSILFYTTKKPDNEPQMANEQFNKGNDPADHLVQGQQQSMNEYASIDSLKTTEHKIAFLPDEKTKLRSVDTIRFSWPESKEALILSIYDNSGGIVKNERIKSGTKQFLLLPGILSPGKYAWQIKNYSKKIRFTIEN